MEKLCNVQLAAYILEVGQCLDCLNRRPVSYYNLDISLYSQPKWSPKGTFHTSKDIPQLELRGDAPALSKSRHVPQACKNES